MPSNNKYYSYLFNIELIYSYVHIRYLSSTSFVPFPTEIKENQLKGCPPMTSDFCKVLEIEKISKIVHVSWNWISTNGNEMNGDLGHDSEL